MNQEELDKPTLQDNLKITTTDKVYDKELKTIAVLIAVVFYFWWRML